MRTQVFPLAVQLDFKSSLPEPVLEELDTIRLFSVSPEHVSMLVQEWIDKTTFEEELEAIMSTLKRRKLKGHGQIMCRIREGETYGDIVYKVGSKIAIKRCEFSIVVKREKTEAPVALTDEEKLALFRDFWQNKHAIPQKSEVYKDFKIGMYYSTADKSSNTMEAIRGIMADKA